MREERKKAYVIVFLAACRFQSTSGNGEPVLFARERVVRNDSFSRVEKKNKTSYCRERVKLPKSWRVTLKYRRGPSESISSYRIQACLLAKLLITALG